MKKFYRNCVLCGCVDYFCLLCEEPFLRLDDVDRHLKWERHRTCMKGVTYFPKFKNEFIIKIRDSYYCEVCNCTIRSVSKAAIHVKLAEHSNYKSLYSSQEDYNIRFANVTRQSAMLVIGGNFLISISEWNGIFENQCMLCNTEFDDEDDHVFLPSHMKKLIQSKIIISCLNSYRKIDESICYCFTCTDTFPYDSIEDHWSSPQHIFKSELFQQASLKKDPMEDYSNIDEDVYIIIKRMKDIQAHKIDIDLANKRATCKECNTLINFTSYDIMNHIKDHLRKELYSDMSETTDSADEAESATDVRPKNFGLIRAKLSKYGRKRYIKLINSGSKGYCTLCDTKIAAHIKNFKQHVNGAKHIGLRLVLRGSAIFNFGDENPTEQFKVFVKAICFVPKLKIVWVNKKICIDRFSFALVLPLALSSDAIKCKCFLCKVEFLLETTEMHVKSAAHLKLMNGAHCITDMNEIEFVREISPSLYHCGICNKIFPGGFLLNKHLEGWSHDQARQHRITADTVITSSLKIKNSQLRVPFSWASLFDDIADDWPLVYSNVKK